METRELNNYIPGYEKWLEKTSLKETDNTDFIRDELLERKEQEKMARKIIDLSNTNMTLEEVYQLENYVWKGNFLISQEMIEGE